MDKALTAAQNGDIVAAVNSLLGYKELYLYLVDEITGMPVVIENDPVYPIIINIAKENATVRKILPLMKIGLQALALANTAVDMVRLFGCPLPSVPKEYTDAIKKLFS